MGFRAYLRDVLVFYITLHTYQLFLSSREIDAKLTLSITLLFLITLWFMLERVGIIPKIG